ncbi:MAG: STAS domain-containing protein [Lachnospiraceae bacterium]|nr:STAS domain-containing protein [Lachnospiraceae bacterium]
MTIREEKVEKGFLIYLSGRLDTVTAPDLEKYMSNRLESLQFLALDLKELQYISSAGLRVILYLQKAMNRQGAMEIRNVNEVNMEVFEMTGFVDILTII